MNRIFLVSLILATWLLPAGVASAHITYSYVTELPGATVTTDTQAIDLQAMLGGMSPTLIAMNGDLFSSAVALASAGDTVPALNPAPNLAASPGYLGSGFDLAEDSNSSGVVAQDFMYPLDLKDVVKPAKFTFVNPAAPPERGMALYCFTASALSYLSLWAYAPGKRRRVAKWEKRVFLGY